MGFGGTARRRLIRSAVLVASALALANCSGSMSSRIDPRYGVAASQRVIEPGQPVPKGGGVYRVGKPYVVAGRVYVPEADPHYSAVGLASWYGDDFHGRYTANGEIFDSNSISAAHPTLPLPSYVRVTNLANHKSIIVRVNDRGPYARDRLIDLSVKTAKLLGFYDRGTAKVRVDYVGLAPLAGSDDRKLMATLRDGTPAEPPVQVASSKAFAPAYGDHRVSTKVASTNPQQTARRDEISTAAAEAPSEPAAQVSDTTVELAAASRASAAVDETPQASPVSAYAPTSYDGAADFMSGRGLY